MLSCEQQYIAMLQRCTQLGHKKSLYGDDDSAQFVQSLFGEFVRHSFAEGFPIYSHKRVAWHIAIKEMLWFLGGDNDFRILQQSGVRIWDSWAIKQCRKDYPIVSKGLSDEQVLNRIANGTFTCNLLLHYFNATNWAGTGLDQTDWAMQGLAKAPYRKSYYINSWNPATTYEQANELGNESVILPACHYGHQLVAKQGEAESSATKLSMLVNIRSNDLLLGQPFNLVQYGALLQMYCLCLSNRTGHPWVPDELLINICDAHIYSNQLVQIPQCIANAQQIRADDSAQCELKIQNRGQTSLKSFTIGDFTLSGYQPIGRIRFDKAYVAGGYDA